MNFYHKFLDLPESETPPDHYGLLGVSRFCDDTKAIHAAAVMRNTQLRGWQTSDYFKEVNAMMDEVAKASIILEDAIQKELYDAALRQKLGLPEGQKSPDSLPAGTPTSPADPLPLSTSRSTGSLASSQALRSPDRINPNMPRGTAAAPPETDLTESEGSGRSYGVFLTIAVGLIAVTVLWGFWVLRRPMPESISNEPVASSVIPEQAADALEPVNKVPDPKTENVATSSTATESSEGKRIVSQFTDMKLALIPAGTFQMGSPDMELGRGMDEGPQHTVRISQPFYMGVYEVTQGEFEKVMGRNPSVFASTSDLNRGLFPVESVWWFGAVEFCNKLSAADGLTPCYLLSGERRNSDQSLADAKVVFQSGTGYRLPTEAEWEYACRAGTTTPFHFGQTLNGEQANVIVVLYDTRTNIETQVPSSKSPTAVGSYAKNAFGLFDMHGNVWEYCHDGYDVYASVSQSVTTNAPLMTRSSSVRVMRGGSFRDIAGNARSARRKTTLPGFPAHTIGSRDGTIGFRVVRGVTLTDVSTIAASNSIETSAPVKPMTPIAPPSPPGSLRLLPISDVILQSGESKLIEVRIERHECQGPVTVQVEDLPKGLTAKPITIAANQELGQFELIAADDVQTSGQTVGVRANIGELRSTVESVEVKTLETEVRRFVGHKGALWRLTLSSDGRRALSWGEDQTMRLWEVDSGREISRSDTKKTGGITNGTAPINGRFVLFSGSEPKLNTVRFWDMENGKELRRFQEFLAPVQAVALSSDGRRAISLDGNGTTHVWDALTGKVVCKPYFDRPGSVDISSDGNLALTLSKFGYELALWTVDTGERVRNFGVFSTESRNSPIFTSAVLSHNRRFVLAGCVVERGMERSWTQLWDAESGRELHRLAEIKKAFSAPKVTVGTVTFSPDDRRALSASNDGTIRGFDVETGRLLGCFRGYSSSRGNATFSADSQRVLGVTADGTVRIWKLFEEGDVSFPTASILRPNDAQTLKLSATNPQGTPVAAQINDNDLKRPPKTEMKLAKRFFINENYFSLPALATKKWRVGDRFKIGKQEFTIRSTIGANASGKSEFSIDRVFVNERPLEGYPMDTPVEYLGPR